MQCNACCKFENDSRCSHCYLEKNGDPLTGWIEEEVLEQTGCSFQVDKFQQLSGLICIVSDVGVPKVVSAFWLSGVRASFFQLEALVSGRINKGSASRGARIEGFHCIKYCFHGIVFMA